MFIQAVIIGMTYNQFWHDDPNLFFLYLEAYERKTENEIDKMDYEAWLQGAYINYALMINHPFAKEHKKYLEHPFGFDKDESKKTRVLTEEEKEKLELKKIELQFNQFGRYVNAYNEQYFDKE